MKRLIDIKNLTSGVISSTIKTIALKYALWMLMIIICITSAFKTFNYASARYACHVQWKESAIEYKYTLRGGCLLKRGDGWIPSGNFRVQ